MLMGVLGIGETLDLPNNVDRGFHVASGPHARRTADHD